MAVATTTRSARIAPPAVCTSAVFRPNVMLLHRRALEDPSRRAPRPRPRGRGRRDTDRRRAVAAAERRTRRSGPTSAPTRAPFSAGASRPASRRALLLLLQPRDLIGGERRPSARCRGSRWHLMSSRRSSAAKSSAARRHAWNACRAASRPERLLDVDEATRRDLGNPAGTALRAAAAEPVRFDERDLDAGGGKRVRRRAPGQAAADDDHVAAQWRRVPRIRRHARWGKRSRQGDRP